MRFKHPRSGIAAHDRLLQLLEIEIGELLKQVSLQFADIDPRQADRRRQLPPARFNEYRGVEQAHFRPVAFDAPEEDVGLGALPCLGELAADVVRPLGDVEQELIDLQPPLRYQQRVIGLPHIAQHIKAGANQLVFRLLHLTQGRLLRQPQLASRDNILRRPAKILRGGAVSVDIGLLGSRLRRSDK